MLFPFAYCQLPFAFCLLINYHGLKAAAIQWLFQYRIPPTPFKGGAMIIHYSLLFALSHFSLFSLLLFRSLPLGFVKDDAGGNGDIE